MNRRLPDCLATQLENREANMLTRRFNINISLIRDQGQIRILVVEEPYDSFPRFPHMFNPYGDMVYQNFINIKANDIQEVLLSYIMLMNTGNQHYEYTEEKNDEKNETSDDAEEKENKEDEKKFQKRKKMTTMKKWKKKKTKRTNMKKRKINVNLYCRLNRANNNTIKKRRLMLYSYNSLKRSRILST